jgi:hypothetical protein
MSICFITGNARSGTTSLLRALGLSSHAEVALEPMPNLNKESRELYDGRLADPHAVLARDVAPRVARALDRGKHYIEKHISFVPFVPHLAELFPCKFLIPIRDGRDVVRSLMDWHTRFMPIFYQECREPTELGPEAAKVLAEQQFFPDPFDYSLPRPDRHDPWFEAWPAFTRFEMSAWYWNYLNCHLLRSLRQLPTDRYLIVDYTRADADTIRRCYDFLSLPGFSESKVRAVLDHRVNSLADRIGEGTRFPKWSDWSPELRHRFWELAFPAMRDLGFVAGSTRPAPPSRSGDRGVHNHALAPPGPTWKRLQTWLAAIESGGPQVARVGATGSAGPVSLGNRTVVSLDTSESATTCDLVVSEGMVDCVADPDDYLRAIARMTTRLLYVTAARGFFNGPRDHRLRWNGGSGMCQNDISAARAYEVLDDEGFAAVEVLPVGTDPPSQRVETVMVASRRAEDAPALAAGHDVKFSWKPYRVNRCPWSLKDLLDLVNRGCAYFSPGGLDLANPLSYFVRMADDLAALPDNRTLGSVGALARREGRVNTAIRLDLDMDLIAIRAMARIAGRRRVPMSVYLLPTSSYYGYFADGMFHRHFVCGPVYKELQDAGCEIGLHVDGLEVYLRHGIDGAAATREELEWLRSCRLTIRGTTGHNVAAVYGAENFELFAGRSVGGRRTAAKDGTLLPLGVLDEAALGLDYEGSGGRPPTIEDRRARTAYLAGLPKGDFLRNPDWMRTYLVNSPYCKWDYDWNIWILGKDTWVIGGRPERPDNYKFGVTWDDVREFVSGRPAAETVLFTLHAIYFGQRSGPNELPIGYNLK